MSTTLTGNNIICITLYKQPNYNGNNWYSVQRVIFNNTAINKQLKLKLSRYIGDKYNNGFMSHYIKYI